MEAAHKLPARSRNLDRRLSKKETFARLRRIKEVVPEFQERLDPCSLCPRRCAARRLSGETGECGLDGRLRVASIARHNGEEPPISGDLGAINVFFSGCNLHCLHCQNWPISQERVGRILTPEELASRILKKWSRGAHSLGWVTPTPQPIGALEAYRLCLLAGFDLPLVHNGGGYDDPGIIRLLSGIVDIWLPDAKTASPRRGLTIQGVPDYPERNLAAIAEMQKQVEEGAARAVVVRHLMLPGNEEDSRRVLQRLWDNFGDRIHLSLMGQYFPTFRTQAHESLGKRLPGEEYDEVVNFAQKLGFQRGWIQQNEVEDGIPLHCLS